MGEVRRGICLLNAGEYDKAAAAFQRAVELEGDRPALKDYLAACLIGQGRHAEAARLLRVNTEGDPGPAAAIRSALPLAASGRTKDGIEALREAIGAPLTSGEQEARQRRVSRLRELLDEETLAAAWAEGRALPADQAIAEALGEPARTAGSLPLGSG